MAYSFTYGGIRAETLGLEVANVVRDILPPVTPRTVPVPQRAGNVFFRTDFEMREIQVQVFVVGSGVNTDAQMQDAQTKVRTIADFLDPTDGLKELIFDDETDKKYNAIVSGDTNLNQILELKRGTITFLVPDVYALSTTEETYTLPILKFDRNSKSSVLIGTNDDIERFRDKFRTFVDEEIDDDNDVTISSNVPRFYRGQEVIISPPSPPVTTGSFTPDVGKFNQNMIIEEGTTNIFDQATSICESLATFQSQGSTLSLLSGLGWTDVTEDTQNSIVQIDTDNAAANEGVFVEALGISASTTYTFSASMRAFAGETAILRIEEFDSGSVLQQTVDSPVFTLNSGTKIRRSVTITTTANADSLKFYLITDVQQDAVIDTDAWQLEQKAYMTSWQIGQTARENEICKFKHSGVFDSSVGTLEFIFIPKSRPQAFGALIDLGQFDAGNAIDRFNIIHGTSVGTSRRTFQFNIVNGSTTTSVSTSATLTNATVEDQIYYVTVRWNLTGSSSDGFLKLTVHDFTNNETISNSVATSLTAPSFSSFPEMFLGTNHNGGNWQNAAFDELKISKTALSDSTITSNISDLRNDINTFILDSDNSNATHYNFDFSLMPTLFLNGNVKQVGKFRFNIPSASATFTQIQLIEISSIDFIDLPSLTIISGRTLIMDFERRVIQEEAGTTTTSLMSELSIDSIFFDLEHETEISFQLRDFDRYTKFGELNTTFVYTPRFL